MIFVIFVSFLVWKCVWFFSYVINVILHSFKPLDIWDGTGPLLAEAAVGGSVLQARAVPPPNGIFQFIV